MDKKLEIRSDNGISIRLQFDRIDRAVFVQSFQNNDEIAFAKFGIDQFLQDLGMDGYIDARVKIALAEKLRSKAASLDAEALKLESDAAQLICPYSSGDLVEVRGELKGRYEVHSIFLYHASWAITAIE